MKRVLCWILALVLLVAVTGCQSPAEPDQKPEALDSELPEKIAYTVLPADLKAYRVGVMPGGAGGATSGGLYYAQNGKFGIRTLDGKLDTGAVYTFCRPVGDCFMVSKEQQVLDVERVDGLNIIGIVDATGKELVPMIYAQIAAIDNRFVRAVSVTGLAESKEERITHFLGADGEEVGCVGSWQLYDLETGKAIPDATGTTNYAAYSYGSYVKYVTDDKQVIVSTPDGTPIPEEAEHLRNGYYYLPSDRTVYDGNSTPCFTVEADGFIPCDSTGVSAYIVAKKQVDGKDRYLLLDTEGKAVTADYIEPPAKVGQFLCAEGNMMDADGKVVAGEEILAVTWERTFGCGWMVKREKGYTLVGPDGQELYTADGKEVQVKAEHMAFYKTVDKTNTYYSYVDKDFTVTGVSVAPWLVRATRDDGTYDLVNLLNSQPLLSGCRNLNATTSSDGRVYIYAENESGVWEIFVIA